MKKNKKKKGPKKGLPVVRVLKDLKAYAKWISIIKEERNNPNSKFHKYNISHNYFYVLYLVVTLPGEDAALPEDIQRLRVVESLTPVHQYLDNDLGFAEYIIPEFNRFHEDGEPTLSYGIVYRFGFKALSLRWFLSRLITTGFLLFAFIKWPIIETILGWITRT